jgi:hypothetical protein
MSWDRFRPDKDLVWETVIFQSKKGRERRCDCQRVCIRVQVPQCFWVIRSRSPLSPFLFPSPWPIAALAQLT